MKSCLNNVFLFFLYVLSGISSLGALFLGVTDFVALILFCLKILLWGFYAGYIMLWSRFESSVFVKMNNLFSLVYLVVGVQVVEITYVIMSWRSIWLAIEKQVSTISVL